MRIEHVAMYVCDLESARDFFMKYFDEKYNSGYHNQTIGPMSYFGQAISATSSVMWCRAFAWAFSAAR